MLYSGLTTGFTNIATYKFDLVVNYVEVVHLQNFEMSNKRFSFILL